MNQWVQKKQTWKAKLAAFQRLASAIQNNLINSTFIEGYVGIVSFADNLMRKERAVAFKIGREVKAKVYYRWFDAYFSQLEMTYLPYTRTLKRKALAGLILRRRYAYFRAGQAVNKYRHNLLCKVQLALLQNLNERKEERDYARRVRQNYTEKTKVDKALVLNPVIDKILPEEQVENSYMDGRSSMSYMHGQSSYDLNARTGDTQSQNDNVNPFKTLHHMSQQVQQNEHFTPQSSPDDFRNGRNPTNMDHMYKPTHNPMFSFNESPDSQKNQPIQPYIKDTIGPDSVPANNRPTMSLPTQRDQVFTPGFSANKNEPLSDSSEQLMRKQNKPSLIQLNFERRPIQTNHISPYYKKSIEMMSSTKQRPPRSDKYSAHDEGTKDYNKTQRTASSWVIGNMGGTQSQASMSQIKNQQTITSEHQTLSRKNSASPHEFSSSQHQHHQHSEAQSIIQAQHRIKTSSKITTTKIKRQSSSRQPSKKML